MSSEDIAVQDLYVQFPSGKEWVKAADGIDAVFLRGQFTAIVGESGCGKSILGQAILGMLPSYVKREGRVIYREKDVLRHPEEVNGFYGREFAIVPQNPGDALNPVRQIGRQMNDILQAGGMKDRNDVHKLQCLAFFGLKEGKRILSSYPHELSGGMLQRVLCAMSICCRPRWILADEPTKGLDEKVCAIVYDNLKKIKKAGTCSMIIITHDIALARMCDAAAVMYAGQILEMGSHVFTKPLHPYTQAFLAALPENGFQPMKGRAPAPGEKLDGCRFALRCPYCTKRCCRKIPPVYETTRGKVRCFLYAPR